MYLKWIGERGNEEENILWIGSREKLIVELFVDFDGWLEKMKVDFERFYY